MKPDVVLTQEEVDACELIRRIPYRQEHDQQFICMVPMFIHFYEKQIGRKVESGRVDDLLFDCLLDGNYSRMDADLPKAVSIVKRLFKRARFDTEPAQFDIIAIQ